MAGEPRNGLGTNLKRSRGSLSSAEIAARFQSLVCREEIPARCLHFVEPFLRAMSTTRPFEANARVPHFSTFACDATMLW